MNTESLSSPLPESPGLLGAVRHLVRLARPKHWIKNVFVLMPLPFALASGARLDWAPFCWGLLGFCLANSAVYVLNDLLDAEADRLHPKKRLRPIASGQVPGWLAVAWCVILLTISLGAGFASGVLWAPALTLIYLGINAAYCIKVKHIALLDVFALASGFLIRVLLGCVLVDVTPSNWLLLCASSLALFLGFAKRRADLQAGLDDKHRPSLNGYSPSFLDQALAIMAGTALISYTLYAVESELFAKGRELASAPFVAYGILNYLNLANRGGGGSPVETAFKSWDLQLCGLGWGIAVMWSLGLW